MGCEACHSSCSTCTGPYPDQCLTCSGELQLDSWSSICVPCCTSDLPSSCCPCGPKGLCTSPTRAARSPMLSSASFGRLLLSAGLVIGLVGALLILLVRRAG